MSITTKYGDNGFTKNFFNKKVKKSDKTIEFSGLIDEVTCYIGIYKNLIDDKKIFFELELIQKDILYILNQKDEYLLQRLNYFEEFINKNNIDLKNFVLPGKNINNSYLHLLRCKVRELERNYIRFFNNKNKILLKYLNRLSDFLFILAEKI